MDYRRFLNQAEESTAPVVGGFAWLADRRVRVAGSTPRGPRSGDGWWRVRVRGRIAEAVAAAGGEDVAAAMARLPRVRGHLLRGAAAVSLVDGEGRCLPLELAPPDEDPPQLAPVTARRWPTGDLLLWEQLEWEGEGEELARRALEDRGGLAGVKAVPAALRAAFAFATVEAASRALQIPAQAGEVRRWLGEIADRGHPRAEEVLRGLAEERARWAPRPASIACARAVPAAADLETEVEEALRVAGARLLSLRRQSGGVVEVRWMFEGQRLISLVAAHGLRVIDSGLCLSGRDDLLTLDSLPGVVRQAMAEEALVITRHEYD